MVSIANRRSKTMNIYLVRHAIAEAQNVSIVDDAARALTPEGIRKMQRIARALAKLGVAPDEIWTSPLVRARQTAELLVAGLDRIVPIETTASLAPEGDFDGVIRQLAARSSLVGVALVGHEPQMGQFAGFLLTGTRMADVRFKKGGVALIEVDHWDTPIRGSLRWLLTPRQMLQMA